MAKLISSENTSAASRNPGASPYIRLPERETYKEFRTFERDNGTRYLETWEISRWGGTWASDLLSTVDITTP